MKQLIACCVILTASTVSNLTLIHRNAVLSSQVARLGSLLETPLNVHLPPLEGFDVFGRPIQVDVQNSSVPTVVLVLSPECPVCTTNWARWSDLLGKRGNSKWTPVFVNLGSSLTQSYLQSHGMEGYRVINSVSKDTILHYKLFATPATILLGHDGKAHKVWVGQLSEETLDGFLNLVTNF